MMPSSPRRFPAAYAVALLLLSAAPVQAQLVGTDSSAGDLCTTKGATRVNADPDFDGREVTLICDGSVWQAETVAAAGDTREIQFNNAGALAADSSFVFTATGRLGIGTAAPQSELHVVDSADAANKESVLTVGNPAVIGDDNADSYINLYGEHDGTVYKGEIAQYSRNMGIRAAPGGEIQFQTDALMEGGTSLFFQDASNTKEVEMVHDGSDFVITNTDGDIVFPSNKIGVGTSSPEVYMHLFETYDSRLKIETDAVTPGTVAGLLLDRGSTDGWAFIDFLNADTARYGMGMRGEDAASNFSIWKTPGAASDVKLFIDMDNTEVGIGTITPHAPLDVNGEIKFSSSGLDCDADLEGGLRWNSTEKTVEMCDGANWRMIAATTAATDCTPDAFSFTDLTSQSLNTMVYSETLNITGIDAGCTVSVTGAGSPQISVNGNAWVGATTMEPGDSLRVRQISSNSADTARIAAVEVGDTTDNWSVTTKAGQTRIFRTTGEYVGGSIGGLSGADTLCQTEAGNRGYSGTWKALLSDSTTSAKDRLTIVYPVVRATNESVTVDSVNLWDGSLENSIDTSSWDVWTGTWPGGNADANNMCGDWADTGESGRFGKDNISNSGQWVSRSISGCGAEQRLYCVDQ